MVSFLSSLIITILMIAIVAFVGMRREPGRPLTWGEAFVAATFMFALFLMAYGVVPDQWLRWAEGDLSWRSDKIGIPAGPFPFANSENVWFGGGIEFGGRGRVIVTAQTISDIIAAGIYIVFLVLNIVAWLLWQRRGKAKPKPAIETSRYGRPLMRKSESAGAEA